MGIIVIRKAEPKDAMQIAKVHVETWRVAYVGQIPDSYLNNLSVEDRASKWKDHLENPDKGKHMFVAEVDGSVVGWCTFGVNRDIDVDNTTAELYGIYVLPGFSGQGLGSMLMDKALSTLKAERYNKSTLWTLESNVKSRRWYENKKWKLEGATKVEQKENAILQEVRYIIEL